MRRILGILKTWFCKRFYNIEPKIYIFDLDGTIINSEFAHYTSYNQCLVNSISYREYQQIFHSNLKTEFVVCNKINKQTKSKPSMRAHGIIWYSIFLRNC